MMRFHWLKPIITTTGLCFLAAAMYCWMTTIVVRPSKSTTIRGDFKTFRLIMKEDIASARLLSSSSDGSDLEAVPPLTVDSPVFTQRLKRANDFCFQSFGGKAGRVIFDTKHRIANCIVPKVGCTFWINVIRFIKNETGGKVFRSPMDIPRLITHYGNASKDDVIWHDKEPPKYLGHMIRFMFVRDPYARLWSAWIDKFFLPDFWYTHGQLIADFFRFTPEEKACPKNISFEQFLTYFTSDTFLENPGTLNDHWAPYKYVCDPCLFRPHVLGKMETFARDSRAILEAANLTWVLSAQTNTSRDETSAHPVDDRSLREMSMLIEYNYDTWLVYETHFNGCFPVGELYQRLWRAFQYNGHLPPDVKIPKCFLQRRDFTPRAFFDVCTDTYTKWRRLAERKVYVDQKKAALVQGYMSVSTPVLKKVQKMFQLDFDMFGYDKTPPELFDYR
ncbi:unnamed protein product [Lymnaea stagnalis]|uniref:Carbohydrate sulfotransferase n=1 Tax=Lymnaea stagnalis TaxID=6523 RepID=A0AAV2IBJ6_LYMST